jgi:hypothetical protein
MNIALIIAGGSGNRMGQDIPKQFMYVENAPIIIHTLQCFQKHPDIGVIAVVCLTGWETVLQSYANQYNVTKFLSSDYSVKAWLEQCTNYPICNISYASVTTSKTSIQLDSDGDNLYKNIEKKVLNDLNSVFNYILVVYCQHNSRANGCYYDYSIRAFNSTGGGSSSSSSEPVPPSSSSSAHSSHSSTSEDSSDSIDESNSMATTFIIIGVILIFAILIYVLYLKFFKKRYSIQQQIENISNIKALNEEESQ